jgi:hypothetical protein
MSESADELSRKMEALKLQIAAQQQPSFVSNKHQGDESHEDDDVEEVEEEYYEEEEIIEDDEPTTSQPAVIRPTVPVSDQNNHHNHQQPTASHTSHVDKMDLLKKQHGFERPDWATQADASYEKPILDDAIDHGLKKAGASGQYQRQVKDATPMIVKGSHVAAKEKVEPRLAWIVVNVDKRKVGKIVMHLHGMGVNAIVENFVELKGYVLERTREGLSVAGINPSFVIMAGGHGGLDDRAGVYGVVQEGTDVFQQVMASDASAALSIKQAHIYPVKLGKA